MVPPAPAFLPLPPTPPRDRPMTIRDLASWFRAALTDPVSELSRWQRSTRRAVRVVAYSVRHLGEDRAPQMAAALSFRTLFGLLPVLVVATVVAKAVFGPQLQGRLQQAVAALGLDRVQLVLPSKDSASAEPVDLGTWFAELVDYAAALDLSTLGWIGFAVVAFSAIWVLVTIESCFNVICRAPSNRGWWQRIPVYWFALTFGPIAIAVIPLVNARIAAAADSIALWGPLSEAATFAADFLLLWGFWVLAYLWVPSTRLHPRSVIAGAFVTAVLLTAGRSSLGLYMRNAFTLNGLYGSLGLVPLFMFWMYLMWLFVLLGLQVASLLHSLRHRRLEDLEESPQRIDFIDPGGTLSLMSLATARFGEGRPLDADEAAAVLGFPQRAVDRMLAALAAAGLLHRIEGEPGYALARPPEQIPARDVLEIGFALADDARRDPGDAWIRPLRDAQIRLADRLDLRSPPAAAAPA